MPVDSANLSPSSAFAAIAMFITLIGIGASMGLNTGYAINFGRDFGPRLFLSLIGYPSSIFTHNSGWAFWGPGLSSMLGGILGGGMYDLFVYTGEDSPVNRVEGGRKAGQASWDQRQRALLADDEEPEAEV